MRWCDCECILMQMHAAFFAEIVAQKAPQASLPNKSAVP